MSPALLVVVYVADEFLHIVKVPLADGVGVAFTVTLNVDESLQPLLLVSTTFAVPVPDVVHFIMALLVVPPLVMLPFVTVHA